MVRKGHRWLNKNLQVKFAALLSAYNLFLPPGINRLTRLTVCKVYKINNNLQTFEKTTRNKKIMHGLHNMFYCTLKEENVHAVFLLYLFVGTCLRNVLFLS